MKENIYDIVQNDIMNSSMNENDRNKMLKNVILLKNQKINILITGATGCGKSSTINALFNTEVAKVGVGVDPETMGIEKYDLDNLTLWDTPGLGDSKEADERHARNIINKLSELDNEGNPLIDLVLVILDGGSRDLGTSYELINNVIIPHLGPEKEKRILVAINQADMAMKGRNWDYEKNEPNEQLISFLDDKIESVKKRIYDATKVRTEPIYYCAGYKEEGQESCNPYNLSKLLYYIVNSTPAKKRLVYTDHINEDANVWKDNDKEDDYTEKTKKELWETVVEYAYGGQVVGEKIGGLLFGTPGRVVGKSIGAAAGGVVGFIKGLFS